RRGAGKVASTTSKASRDLRMADPYQIWSFAYFQVSSGRRGQAVWGRRPCPPQGRGSGEGKIPSGPHTGPIRILFWHFARNNAKKSRPLPAASQALECRVLHRIFPSKTAVK